MERHFKTIRVSDRLPDLGKRILFLNQNYTGEFMTEYVPEEKIEIKKGKFIEIKDCKIATDYLLKNFTHWLEEINI